MSRESRFIVDVGDILGVRVCCAVEGCLNEMVYRVPLEPPTPREFSAPAECTACRDRGQYGEDTGLVALLRAMQRVSGVRFEMRAPATPHPGT